LPPFQLLAGFHHLFLALKYGQPRVVEVIPQLDPLAVQILVIRSKTCA
jgi:hypothetical protein